MSGAAVSRLTAALYWLSTVLIALETFAGGATDLVHGQTALVSGPSVADVVTQLGYPVYVLTILAACKLPGAVVLIAPGLPRLKEWAYAGIVFEMGGASASYALHGGTAGDVVGTAFLAALALISWAMRPPNRKLNRARQRSTEAPLPPATLHSAA